MRSYLSLIVSLISLLLSTGFLHAGEQGTAYCYVSLVEGDAFVLQSDADAPVRAVVNFPITSGDTLITGDEGRCEIQFDNGTVMRLDKESRMKVHVLRAESMTTNWEITSLELLSGQLFSMNNTYNREMFQIATSRAVFKLNRNSTMTLAIEGEKTLVAVDKGRVDVLYGEEKRKLRKEFVRAGKAYVINSNHKLTPGIRKPGAEFSLWNQYVNKNFKDLHYGKSRVPKPIYRFPRGVVKFAEKWSSLYGQWVYNELLGYVWKPYDESFQYPDKRPFFNADFVRIKNELYLVPQQPWGWIPAHLGNWVWMKKNGWVWIPGTAFKPGMYGADWLWDQMNGYRPYLFWVTLTGRMSWGAWPDYFWLGVRPGYGPSGCSTLSDWLHYVYGGYQGYRDFRDKGVFQAGKGKRKKSGAGHGPSLKNLPKGISAILNRINKVPLAELNRMFALNRSDRPLTANRLRRDNLLKERGRLSPDRNIRIPTEAGVTGPEDRKSPYQHRDWNPDRIIARRMGMRMEYSSGRNAVMLPELGLSSKTITARDRFRLRTLSFRIKPGMTKSSLIRHFSGGSVSGVNPRGASPTVSRGTAGKGSSGTSKSGTSISSSEKK